MSDQVIKTDPVSAVISAAAPDASDVMLAKYHNLQQLQAMGVPLYPHSFTPDAKPGVLQDKYGTLPLGEKTTDKVRIAGRVMSIRNSGMFIDLRDASGNRARAAAVFEAGGYWRHHRC